MISNGQINALIYDYLDRNYKNLDDILPALKKALKLTNRSKPFGKLEEIVSAQKKIDQNNKRKHDINEDGLVNKSGNDADIIENLTPPNKLKCLAEPIDTNPKIVASRKGLSLSNEVLNETISISDPSQDKNESNEIPSGGRSLLSDEDGIILSIKSINKNIDSYNRARTSIVSLDYGSSDEESDTIVSEVKTLNTAKKPTSSAVSTAVVSENKDLERDSNFSSIEEPIQNRLKTVVSKKLPCKTSNAKVTTKSILCSADEEISRGKVSITTVSKHDQIIINKASSNPEMIVKHVPNKKKASEKESPSKSEKVENRKSYSLTAFNRKSEIKNSSDVTSITIKNKSTTQVSGKIPIVKTNTQLQNASLTNSDSDSSWSSDGEDEVSITAIKKPDKQHKNKKISDGSVLPSVDVSTLGKSKTTRPPKTNILSKSTDASSDSPCDEQPITKVVKATVATVSPKIKEHLVSENNAKESVNKPVMKPTVPAMESEPVRVVESVLSEPPEENSDKDSSLPSSEEEDVSKQIKTTTSSNLPPKTDARIMTNSSGEASTRAQPSLNSKNVTPSNDSSLDSTPSKPTDIYSDSHHEEQPVAKVATVNLKSKDNFVSKNNEKESVNKPAIKPTIPAMESELVRVVESVPFIPPEENSDKGSSLPTSEDEDVSKQIKTTTSNIIEINTRSKTKTSTENRTRAQPLSNSKIVSTSNDSSLDSSDNEEKHLVRKTQTTAKPSNKDDKLNALKQKTKVLKGKAKQLQKPSDNDSKLIFTNEDLVTSRYKPLPMTSSDANTRAQLPSNSKDVFTSNDSSLDSSDNEEERPVRKTKITSNKKITAKPSNKDDKINAVKQKTLKPTQKLAENLTGTKPFNSTKVTLKGKTKPIHKPSENDSKLNFTDEDLLTARYKPLPMKTNEVPKIPSNTKNVKTVTKQKVDSKVTAISNPSKTAKSTEKVSEKESESDDSLSSDDDEVISKQIKDVNGQNESSHPKNTISKKPTPSSSDSDSSMLSSLNGEEMNTASNAFNSNSTTSVSVKPKSAASQKPTASLPDCESFDVSLSGYKEVKSKDVKISNTNSTAPVSANSKSKVSQKPIPPSSDSESSELSSSDDEEVKSKDTKISNTNSTTSISINSKSKISQKANLELPCSDSSDLSSSDQEISSKSKSKISSTNSTTSVSANKKSAASQKPTASLPDCESSSVSSSDAKEVKSKDAKILNTNSTTSVSANSKHKISQKPIPATLDSESSELLSSGNEKMNIKSKAKISNTHSTTSVPADLKLKVSQKPIPTSPDSDSSVLSSSDDDIVESEAVKTYKKISTTSVVSANPKSRIDEKMLTSEDSPAINSKNSSPMTSMKCNSLPQSGLVSTNNKSGSKLISYDKNGKTVTSPSKFKNSSTRKPRPSKFVHSDSSDDEFRSPLPNNNAASRISIISKLTSKGVVTKLPTMSSKSLAKPVLDLESDPSSELSDDEEDMKIISEAVARTAKKALSVNKPKFPTITVVKSVSSSKPLTTNSDSDSSIDSSDEEDKMAIKKTEEIKKAPAVSENIKRVESSSDLTSESESEPSEKIAKDSNPSKAGGDSNAGELQNTSEDDSSSFDSSDIKTPTLQPVDIKSPMFSSSSSPGKQLKKKKLLNSTDTDDNKIENDLEIQSSIVRVLDMLTKEEGVNKELGVVNHYSKTQKSPIKSGGRVANQGDNDSESSSESDIDGPVVEEKNLKVVPVKGKGDESKQINAKTFISKVSKPFLSSDDSSDDIAKEIPCAQSVTIPKGEKSNAKSVSKSSKRSVPSKTNADSSNEFKEPPAKKPKQSHISTSPSKISKLPLKELSKTKTDKKNLKSMMTDSEDDDFKASNSKTTNARVVSKKGTKDTKKKPLIENENVSVKKNKSVKMLTLPPENDNCSSDDSTSNVKQMSSDNLKSKIKEKPSANVVSKTQAVAEVNKINIIETNKAKPEETCPINSRKRKPSITSDDLTLKVDQNKAETSHGEKPLKKGKASSESDDDDDDDDDEEEEVPKITFKKKSLMDSISSILTYERSGAVASTPINRAVRLNTPNASIIRPLVGKKKGKTNNILNKSNNSFDEKVKGVFSTRKPQSSSESSSDSEDD